MAEAGLMNIGFTGTREGMTPAQKSHLSFLLDFYLIMIHNEFHHGGCVGADAEAHEIALGIQRRLVKIVVHPPTDKKLYTGPFREPQGGLVVLPDQGYLERNHAIVDACDILIAATKDRYEITRSGTWSTVRYARKIGKRYICMFPDGTYDHGGFDATSSGVQGR